jgi:hypothetical protein
MIMTKKKKKKKNPTMPAWVVCTNQRWEHLKNLKHFKTVGSGVDWGGGSSGRDAPAEQAERPEYKL